MCRSRDFSKAPRFSTSPRAIEETLFVGAWSQTQLHGANLLCLGAQMAPARGTQQLLVQNVKTGQGPGLFVCKGDKHLIYKVQASPRKEKTTEQPCD